MRSTTQMHLITTAEGGSVEDIGVEQVVLAPVRLAVGAVQSVLTGGGFTLPAGNLDTAVASMCALAMGMIARSDLGAAEIGQLRTYLLDPRVAVFHARGLDKTLGRTADVWQAYELFVQEVFAGPYKSSTPGRAARALSRFQSGVRFRAATYATAIFAAGEMAVYGEELEDFAFFWRANPNPAVQQMGLRFANAS